MSQYLITLSFEVTETITVTAMDEDDAYSKAEDIGRTREERDSYTFIGVSNVSEDVTLTTDL